MRRLTKPAPIGGALACNSSSGAATSLGRAPGTVATNCATFITGPRKFPRTFVKSAALEALKTRVPPSARPAPRAATPVRPADTRANRVKRRASPFSRSFCTDEPPTLVYRRLNKFRAVREQQHRSVLLQSGTVKPAFYLSNAKIAAL